MNSLLEQKSLSKNGVILILSTTILILVLKEGTNHRVLTPATYLIDSINTNNSENLGLNKNKTVPRSDTENEARKLAPSYNDFKMMMLEQIHFKDNNESKFYANKNYFYPTKVRIVSTPWNVCVNEQGKDLDALIYLWIRVLGFELRNTIRKTWANRTTFPTVNVVFILGLSVDPAVNLKVLEENERYGDIIQGDFIDAYRNLSFKSYIQWRWTTYMCKNAKFYAKQDDDVMLNTPVLVKFLNNKSVFNPPEVSFSGQVLRGSVADRNKNGKFYASFEEWPEPVYKTYTNGPFYVNFPNFITNYRSKRVYLCKNSKIMTKNLPTMLYNASYVSQDLWIADVRVE
jgi:hypothetical protein